MRSFIEFLQSTEGQRAMAGAVRKAVAKLHAAGLPSVGLIDGVLCERYADGRIVPVRTEGIEAVPDQMDRPQLPR